MSAAETGINSVVTTPIAEERIPRYTIQQRIHHWLLAGSFVALLLTGLAVILGAPAGLLRATSVVHRIAAVLLTLAPVLYAVTYPKGLLQLVRDSFSYDKDDLQWLRQAPAYFFGRAHGMPPQGRINAGEKVHHALVIILLIGMGLSGYVLWFSKGKDPSLFMVAGIVHDLAMVALAVLLFGHLYFTAVYSAWRAMLDGTVSRAYAQMEHKKWLDAIDAKKAVRFVRGVGPGKARKPRSKR